MEEETKIALKQCFDNKNFKEYNSILRKEIIKKYESKIQVRNSEFSFSTVPELIEAAEFYLETQESRNLKKFYEIEKNDYLEEVRALLLMENYKKIV